MSNQVTQSIFNRIYIINCIGCNHGGSKKYILSLLEQPLPSNVHYIFIIPQTISSCEIAAINQFQQISYTLVTLHHFLFGTLFRIPLELLLASVSYLFKRATYISLSNYSLSFSSSSFLLVHNAFIASPESFIKSKRSILLPTKKAILSIFARSGSTFIVQTRHMQSLLSNTLKNKYHIKPTVEICANPLPSTLVNLNPKRLFRNQLFFPASPHHHKQVSIVSDAVYSLKDSLPHLGLVLTADKPVDFTSNCIYTGQISYEEVQSYYGGSDILVFTSSSESLGLPLLEAMSFGLAIIAPDLPYAKELLGDASPYFINGSVESLVNSILVVLDDLTYWKSKSSNQFHHLKSLNNNLPTIWEIIERKHV